MQYDIAVLEVNGNHRRTEPVNPRPLGEITSNRFCTVLAWENPNWQPTGIPLRMFSMPIVNSSMCGEEANTYCTRPGSLSSTFPNCGGLMGAPVFCGGDAVAGIVVRDNFCMGSSSVGGSFLSVGNFREWIEEVSSLGTKVTLKTTLFLIGLLLSNLY